MKKVIFLSYAFLLSLFTFFSYLFVGSDIPNLNIFYSGFFFSERVISSMIYAVFILLFFVFYIYFVLSAKRKILDKKDLKVLIAITICGLFFSYPAMLSYDIFNYIATSKVLFFYHENPYAVMPIEFTGDSLLGFTHAANKIALYGLLWIILAGIPYFLGFGSFVIALFSFKIFIAFFYFSTIFLVFKISKNIMSLVLFAFNPLIIIETLVSGHNDIVMIFFVLLSFFLFTKKKVVWAIFFFILSILIKYATVLLIPVFFFIIWKIIKRREINWGNVFYYSSLLMMLGFLVSPIREEIYPWYAIWYLSFSFLVPNKKILVYTSAAFSFGLLFRYVPFMLSGTHAGFTPIIKSSVTFIPVLLVIIYFGLKKIWARISFL